MNKDYPRYFKNKETKNVYKFISESEGNLHIVNDGTSRFPSDYSLRNLHSHVDSSMWEEVAASGASLLSEVDLFVPSNNTIPEYITCSDNPLENFKVLEVFSVVGENMPENSINVLCEYIDEKLPEDKTLSISSTAGYILGNYFFLTNISKESMKISDDNLSIMDNDDFHAYSKALHLYKKTH